MKRTGRRRIGWMLFLSLTALPGAVAAGYYCQPSGPSCTICHNFSPEGEYQGWIEACQ
jgi:hypothetical protein